MATPEDEIRNLKENNNELVQKVQFLKMLAAEKENEKLNLMKEINELRLKLSQQRMTFQQQRSTDNDQVKKMATALHSSSERVLSYLIKASNEITSSMDLVDGYIKDRDESGTLSPRWTALSANTSSERKDKVHRVPPMMGGQTIQPVVALNRMIFDTNRRQTARRTPIQNGNVPELAVPMHMLQDVYIPLTRIDMQDINGMEIESDNNDNDNDNSSEQMGSDDDEEGLNEDSERMSDHRQYVLRLEGVEEVSEPEESPEAPPRSRLENPLEGPSWMLDVPNNQIEAPRSPEPDSTTEPEAVVLRSPILPIPKRRTSKTLACPSPLSHQFSPTVRRRKRSHSPPASPYSPILNRHSASNRILKVVVAKMQIEAPSTPPSKRATGANGAGDAPGLRFDAPSPNGATVPGVIVSEDVERRVKVERQSTNQRANKPHNDRGSRSCSSDSDSGGAEGRTRRPRKPVTYKEKPLNRKMRRS